MLLACVFFFFFPGGRADRGRGETDAGTGIGVAGVGPGTSPAGGEAIREDAEGGHGRWVTHEPNAAIRARVVVPLQQDTRGDTAVMI